MKPDVAVLDAKLPGLNGVDILRRVAKKLPEMRVLVFSGHENHLLVRDMLEAGAHGRRKNGRAFRVQARFGDHCKGRHLFWSGRRGPAAERRGKFLRTGERPMG
ncbi:MAG: response regulator [Opitutaceae bacterium]